MTRSIFINNNFKFLWLGRIISQLGDKFYAIALALWVLYETDSPGAMGLYLVATMLPGILLGLFTGPWVDRVSKKVILIAADLLRGTIMMGLMALSMTGLLAFWHIIGASIVLSFLSSFFETAFQAVIPEMVDQEELPKANSLTQLVSGLCTVLGPVLGASTVSWVGFNWIFVINAASFFASALFETQVIYVSNKNPNSTTHIVQDLMEGFDFLKKQNKALLIIAMIGVAHFFMGSIIVAIPFMSTIIRGVPAQNVGWMEAAMGAGFTIGAIIVGLSRKSDKGDIKEAKLFLLLNMSGFCFLLTGLSLLYFCSLLPYLFLLLILGFLIVNASVFWQTLLQNMTPKAFTGRVFSISTLVGNLSLPIAFGVYGQILESLSLSMVLVLSGCCLILFTGTLLLIFKKPLDQPI